MATLGASSAISSRLSLAIGKTKSFPAGVQPKAAPEHFLWISNGDLELFTKATRFLSRYRVPLFANRKEKDVGGDGLDDNGRK
jgi:hypothetical protein